MNAGSYTQVQMWIGEASFARCVGDRFDGDDLTITSIDTEEIVRVIPAGEWREATTYANGYPLYTLKATTPAKTLDFGLVNRTATPAA